MGATRKTMIFLLAVILLIVALPYIIPLNVFLTDGIEQTVGAKLKRRVSIGDVHFSYQPYPTIILDNVQIGPAGQDGSIRTVELQVDLLTVFSDSKRLRKFMLQEASFTKTFLQQIPALLKPVAGAVGKSYNARLIEVRQGTVATDNKQYGPFEAEIYLNLDQSFNKVVVHNPSRSVVVQISPLKNNAYAVALTAKNWEAPIGPKPLVESLVLDAETEGSRLLAKEINGRIAGGSFKGSAVLDWTSGVAFGGQLALDSMDGDLITKWFNPHTNFTGSLSGTVDITSSSENFDTLFANPSAKVVFESKNGVLNNFDFVTPMRSNTTTSGKQGGSTKYETLSGTLNYSDDAFSITGIHIKAGSLSVVSSMNVVKKKLSGSASVKLGNGVNHRSLNLRLGGMFDSPIVIPPSRAGAESSVVVISQ